MKGIGREARQRSVGNFFGQPRGSNGKFEQLRIRFDAEGSSLRGIVYVYDASICAGQIFFFHSSRSRLRCSTGYLERTVRVAWPMDNQSHDVTVSVHPSNGRPETRNIRHKREQVSSNSAGLWCCRYRHDKRFCRSFDNGAATDAN